MSFNQADDEHEMRVRLGVTLPSISFALTSQNCDGTRAGVGEKLNIGYSTAKVAQQDLHMLCQFQIQCIVFLIISSFAIKSSVGVPR